MKVKPAKGEVWAVQLVKVLSERERDGIRGGIRGWVDGGGPREAADRGYAVSDEGRAAQGARRAVEGDTFVDLDRPV